jgi:hypothetical protein
MSSGTSPLTIFTEEQKFNRDNLLRITWNTNINQLLGSKGLLGYIDGKVTRPPEPFSDTPTPDPTPIYLTNPSFDKWNYHNHLVPGHITLDCTDITGLVIMCRGTRKI